MNRLLAIITLCTAALTASAQEATSDAAMNLLRHPETKRYGYAMKAQNVMSPIRSLQSKAIDLAGSAASVLINKANAEYIDWVIPPQYDAASTTFSANLAMVKIDGHVGFIDMTNRFVIPPIYDNIDRLDGFHRGLAAVCKDGKWGFIDALGVARVPFIYDEVESFENQPLIAVKKGTKWGAIDMTGATVVPFQFLAKAQMVNLPVSNKPYRTALAAAQTAEKNGDYKARTDSLLRAAEQVKQQAQTVAPPILKCTIVEEGGKHGAKDEYGRMIVPCAFDNVIADAASGAFVTVKDGKYGLYSCNGGRITGTVFDTIRTPSFDGVFDADMLGIGGWVAADGTIEEHLLPSLCHHGEEVQESNPDEARLYYEAILKINPEYPAAYNNLALLDLTKRDFNKGISRLKTAHELAPEDPVIAANLQMAQDEQKGRRTDRAMAGLKISVSLLTAGVTAYSAYSAVRTIQSLNNSTSSAGTSLSASGASTTAGECPTCHGTGKCASSSALADRHYCHGTGKCDFCANDEEHTSDCRACGGTQTCRYCNGDGLCKTCHGTGRIGE